MANFNFNLREATATGETPVNLVIRYNNKRFVYPTGLTIFPKYWETDKEKKNFQRAKSSLTNYKNFNNQLENLKNGADNVFLRFSIDNKREPSFDELRKLLDIENQRETFVKYDLFTFFDKFIEDAKIKTNEHTGRVFSDGTIKLYKNSLTHLKAFAKTKNRKIDFDNIDLDFYQDFTEYLTIKKTFATNTIGRIIKIIKTILNEATERGINKNLSFRSKRFRVITEKVDSVYLTDSELTDLYNVDLSENKRLERVRDLFLIGCHTGLRFSDFSKLTTKNINGKFIEVLTQKTAESIVIPMHKVIEEILEKYNNRLPIISNQKMNTYLKEVCDEVDSLKEIISLSNTKGGVKVIKQYPKYKLITSHTARRSFATNAYLAKVPPFVIMGVTGHKTEKAFFDYIKITSNEKAKILQMYMQEQQQFNLKAV